MELLWYSTKVSWFNWVGSDTEGQRTDEITMAQRRLLWNVVGKDELDMSWWWICSDIALLQMGFGGRVEAGSSCLNDSDYWKSQQRFKDVEGSSGKCREETLELFRNCMWLYVLRKFLDYNPNVDEGKDNKLVDSSMVLLSLLDAWVATVVTCLTEREKRGSLGQKVYADTYGRLLTLTTEQLTGNMRLFVE